MAHKLKPNIIDRPLPKGKSEVSVSAFSFLFSEIVQYNQGRTKSIQELENRLAEVGKSVGYRFYDLIVNRERQFKRDTKIVTVLYFIQTVVWKSLFGKPADSLEKSISNDNEYMIFDFTPLTNKYISLPSDLAQLSCGSFAAGVVQGILEAIDLKPEMVAAHNMFPEDKSQRLPVKSFILIRFPFDTNGV